MKQVSLAEILRDPIAARDNAITNYEVCLAKLKTKNNVRRILLLASATYLAINCSLFAFPALYGLACTLLAAAPLLIFTAIYSYNNIKNRIETCVASQKQNEELVRIYSPVNNLRWVVKQGVYSLPGFLRFKSLQELVVHDADSQQSDTALLVVDTHRRLGVEI